MQIRIEPADGLKGTISVPGDKSVSHRAVMLSSLSAGNCSVSGLLLSEDCLRTVECFKAMGVKIEGDASGTYRIEGKGLYGLKQPKDILYVGNSGTTIRLMLGILAGQGFDATVTGDESIKRRPMLRVVEPLRLMGAKIHGRDGGKFAPLEIIGGSLQGISWDMPVASAQVKSCLMLAGLYASGETAVCEPSRSRDHTENMFRHFGIPFRQDGNRVTVGKVLSFPGRDIDVPGDISSAAFFMVAACIVPDSALKLANVGINPSRTGIIEVLKKMGADITVENERTECGERRADITVRSSDLKGCEISGDLIPRLIDEIPVIAVAASFADGETVIKDARELKVKESDRIAVVAEEYSKLGMKIKPTDDGMIIKPVNRFKGGKVESHGDHRIAMSLAIAGLAADDAVIINDTECIETSFPGFEKLLRGSY